jgi:hypothetical protein
MAQAQHQQAAGRNQMRCDVSGGDGDDQERRNRKFAAGERDRQGGGRPLNGNRWPAATSAPGVMVIAAIAAGAAKRE